MNRGTLRTMALTSTATIAALAAYVLGVIASSAPMSMDTLRGLSLLSGREKIEFLTSGRFRKEAGPILAPLSACLRDYSRRSPHEDARRAATTRSARLYYHAYSGFDFGYEATGLAARCNRGVGVGIRLDMQLWMPLPQYNSGGTDGHPRFSLMERCNRMAIEYGTAYNVRMLLLRPDLMKRACTPLPGAPR